MSSAEIDRYLSGLDPGQRRALEALRRTNLSISPDAEQEIAYGMPAFKVNGKAVCGFAAYKEHLSDFPTAARCSPS